MAYLFNMDVIASVKNLFSSEPTIDIGVSGAGNPSAEVPGFGPKQVFHVSNNKYTYGNAKAICAAYDSRLATISEVQKAYNKGANWCSYGWSADQLALFPTQFERWEQLQSVEGHENDCGRPGVNGGYIANPNVRFGVNCYGRKPAATRRELKRMYYAGDIPTTAGEQSFNQRVRWWKNRLSSLQLSPYNSSSWSSGVS